MSIKKGVHCSIKTEFKKGHPQFNTGKTHFKKGFTPWSKGKKLPQFSGKNASNWKGGRVFDHSYLKIYKPNHPRADSGNYVKRAVLVMEKKIGRFLKPKEIVHHKGIKYPVYSIKNKQDDRIKNLQLFKNESKHQKLHSLTNPWIAKGHPPNQTSFKKGHPYHKKWRKRNVLKKP